MSNKNKETYNAYKREYMLRRYHRRRAEVVQRLGGICVWCGSDKDLEIDHIDHTEKSFDLGPALASCSEKRVQAELRKCQLLCSSCHTEKTMQDLGQQDARKTHGTLSSYRYCRCDLCREAKAVENRSYKARRKEKRAQQIAAP